MENTKTVLGIIGLNFGGNHLAGALKNGFEVGAICDIDPEMLKKVGDENNIPEAKRFTDYKDLLNNPEITAVVIATPDPFHRSMTEEFLNAGKHVMCEKPLALDRENLEAIVKTAKKNNKICMVGQICRFTPAFIKAKELVESGTIGELYYVESEYAHDYMRIVSGKHGWRSDPKRHGVIGGGCHAVDLLRWIAGDPQEVFSYGVHKLLPTVPYDDATISVMKFPNNVIGKVFVSTGCKRDYTMRTVIYGTKGTIICDNTSDTMQLFTVTEEGDTIFPAQILPVDINNHNAVREVAVFVDCINGAPLMMSAEEGAKSIVACLAITESAKTGEKVIPNYNFD